MRRSSGRFQVLSTSGTFAPDIIFHGDETEEIGDTTGRPLHTKESPDSPLIKAIDALPDKFGKEMQDALGMYHDPINENDFYFAKRLKETYPKLTYEEIACMVGEHFPNSKYHAGEGETLRKALKPSKTTPKKKSKNRK